MGYCPKCGKEIDSLTYYSTVETEQDFSIESDGTPNYGETNDFGSHDNEEYTCLYCNEVLAYNEDDAIKALNHELTKQEATKIMLSEKQD